MANQPNLYELSGGGIHITYATTGLQGQPHFSYHDAVQVKNFTGNQITTVQTSIGLLVTVLIHLTVDAGSTTFSVLLPNVNLPAPPGVAHITAEGVTTLHRFSIFPIQGQTEFYTVVPMQGTARHVVF
jgi:hypothetical protein